MNTERAQVGCTFWLWWVLASGVGLTVGAVVGLVVGALVAASIWITGLGGLVGLAVAGAGPLVGTLQWLVVRRHATQTSRWVRAIVVGWAVVVVVSAIVSAVLVFAVGAPDGLVLGASGFVVGGLVLMAASTVITPVWLSRQPSREHMEEIVEQTELENASRGTRLGSALIDMLIIVVLTSPLAYFMGGFDYIQAGEQPPITLTAVMAIVSIIVYTAINGKLLSENGQTIGKRVNNIRIVNLDGSKPKLHQLILKRYVPFIGFPFIPFIGSIVNLVNLFWIFGKQSRCLHDHIAGTKVVKG